MHDNTKEREKRTCREKVNKRRYILCACTSLSIPAEHVFCFFWHAKRARSLPSVPCNSLNYWDHNYLFEVKAWWFVICTKIQKKSFSISARRHCIWIAYLPHWLSVLPKPEPRQTDSTEESMATKSDKLTPYHRQKQHLNTCCCDVSLLFGNESSHLSHDGKVMVTKRVGCTLQYVRTHLRCHFVWSTG